MDKIAQRPENRRRQGVDGVAVQPLSEAELAGLRSEAFAEDLPEPPSVEVPPPLGRQLGGLLPQLGLAVAGVLAAWGY